MARHFIAVGEVLHKAIIHEDIWMFCHDEISPMTSKENVEWMESQGYLERWWLPQFNLNSHIRACPVGQHAGANACYQSQNEDNDDVVLRHVAVTRLLAEEDPKKFSLSAPVQTSCAFSPCPNILRTQKVPLQSSS